MSAFDEMTEIEKLNFESLAKDSYEQEPEKVYELTEYGNGELIADHIRGQYIYVPELNNYLVYDGKVWREDADDSLTQKVGSIFRAERKRAAAIPDPKRATEIFKWYTSSENERRLKASINLAFSMHGMRKSINDFDSDDTLLNVQNGVVDLKTCKLLPHSKDYYMTRICNASYDYRKDGETFIRFLQEITEGDTDKEEYIHRLCGYCCSGQTIEQQFYQCKGAGANGKSVLWETIKHVLGTYAVESSPDILMAKSIESVPNDVARLKGARMILMSEPDPGKKFSDNAIKSLTGGDTVVARFLHREWFEFRMKGKLIMLTNHEIRAIGSDHGLWRRMVVIPFNYTVPEDKRDKRLQEKLLAEADFILSWLIGGCYQWQQHGLEQPQELLRAKDEYRAGQDAVGLFIDECCVIGPKAKVTVKELYIAYQQWCDDTGEYELTQRQLGVRLREKGFISEKTGVFRWLGIGLQDKNGLTGQSGQKTGNFPIVSFIDNLSEFSPESPVSPEDDLNEIFKA